MTTESCFADPDPGSGAFLTSGSGIRIQESKIGKKIKARIRDEHPESYCISGSLETIFWVKNT
jgi:hypothetical protein